MIKKERKAQVWVETVIYTLIGLAIIGILLAVSRPKIEEMKDKLLIEQTIDSMNKIDSEISAVQRSPANRRTPDLKISKGKLIIDGEEDRIYWIIDSKYQYSEVGEEIDFGNLKIITEESSPFTVTISANYSIDLTYGGENVLKEIVAAPSPYSLIIENFGSSDGNIRIDLKVE